MELKQLEHFVAAAEEGSFTAAARRTNIVQSGLSMSIRALEVELGAPLFTRHSRHVTLTAAGQALLPEARRALAAVRSARGAVTGTQELTRGEMTIGISQVPASADRLVPLLAEFRGAYPGIGIRIQQDSPAGTLDRVAAGKVDLAICSMPQSVPRPLTTVILASSSMNLVCAPTHPFARRECVALEEIADEPFIDLHVGWATRASVDRAFENAGLRRQTVCECHEVTLILKLVEQGLGISVVPLIGRELGTAVSWVPLAPPPPEWQLGASFLGEEPANVAARELLRMLRRTIGPAYSVAGAASEPAEYPSYL